MSEATRVSRPLLVAAEAVSDRLRAALEGVEGVEAVRIGAGLEVTYDAARVDYPTLMAAAEAAGAAAARGWLARLRRAWYGYLDGNLRANARAKAGPCCSNPTEILAQRRRR
ncbi:hypothetical protein [Inmirania thermothiophila]|uniref:Uncharacterized protein n=1 Tax=Inmirania thermothiophila TaxID=1750597 RepID=A0A3N1Y8B8_9GAMM|nr:hypothetical protein [Inmirania thermothiophila]ROR34781.1 hypothetical protein EDC57_0685 [Inmirania thermothiophila]